MTDFVCKHIKKNKDIKDIYVYKLIGKDLVICPDCEKRLRQQIVNQIKLENKIKTNGKK